MSNEDRAPPYPRAVTHVGITVTDMAQGIAFYEAVFGAQLFHGPLHLTAGDDLFGRICKDVYGDRFGEAYVAFLGTANGVALELFQFVTPKTELRPEYEYWKAGFSHLCLLDPDVDGAVERIVAHGGRRRSQTWAPWGEPKKLALCEDPFGNVLEIYSHSTEQMVANLH